MGEKSKAESIIWDIKNFSLISKLLHIVKGEFLSWKVGFEGCLIQIWIFQLFSLCRFDGWRVDLDEGAKFARYFSFHWLGELWGREERYLKMGRWEKNGRLTRENEKSFPEISELSSRCKCSVTLFSGKQKFPPEKCVSYEKSFIHCFSFHTNQHHLRISFLPHLDRLTRKIHLETCKIHLIRFDNSETALTWWKISYLFVIDNWIS